MRSKADYPDSQTPAWRAGEVTRRCHRSRRAANYASAWAFWHAPNDCHSERVMWPGRKIQLERLGYDFLETGGMWVTVWSAKPLENAFNHRFEAPISLAKKMHTLFQLNCVFSCQKYICQRACIVNYAQMLIVGPWWGLSTNPKSLCFFSGRFLQPLPNIFDLKYPLIFLR